MEPATFLVYGMQASWYTGKIRPYLRYKGIRFVEKLPTAFTWYVTIKRRCGDSTMPVLVTPEGEWLQDTSIIIERLEDRFPEPAVVPREPVQRFVAHLIELWADEFWQASGLYTRWKDPANYPAWADEIGRAFAPGLPGFVQRRVAGVPARQMRAYLPTLGASPEQVPLLERWTERQLDALDAHFATLPFLLGTRPAIADFGLMGPLAGHLYFDVGSRRSYLEPRPHVYAWVRRMNDLTPRQGEFSGDDGIPGTLTPVLRSIFDEMVPYLAGATDHVRELYSRLAPGERLPRLCGLVEFPLAADATAGHACPTRCG